MTESTERERTRLSTIAVLLAFASIGGTVLLVWPFFPLNVIWGTVLGSASTVTAAFALRAEEPAPRWVLLLALATLVLQVLVMAAFWAPSLFYQG